MRVAVGLFVMAVLTGCAAGPAGDAQSRPEETSTAEPAVADGSPAPSPPPPPPPRPVFDPAVFEGLTADRVEERYGLPALKRHDGIAQVWQYMAGDCILYLFLYGDSPDVGADGFRVEHVEAKMRPTPDNEGLSPEEVCAGPFGVLKDLPTTPAGGDDSSAEPLGP